MPPVPTPPARYRVLEVLRDDPVESLVRAHDSVLQREVLLKAPGEALLRHLRSTGDLERLLREARALAPLRHEHVVRLLDVAETPGGPFLVLEPVAGETLEARVARDGPFDAAAVRRIGRGLASALAALHRTGAIHRAVAPEHVVLDAGGSPVLAGFGFAKFTAGSSPATSIVYAGKEPSTTETLPPALPRYVAPEQLAGQPADARTDLFALGSLLHFALTGTDPLPGDARPRGRPERGKDPALEAILRRCLARSPLQRFQDASELEEALDEAGSGVAEPASGAAGPRRQHARAIVLASAAAAVLVIAGAIRWFGAFDGSHGDASRGAALQATSAADGAAADGGYAPLYTASHALLIGIGDAYAAQGYPVLANAESDVAALRDRLLEMPWENWQVRTLTGATATKNAVQNALADLAESDADDRVLLYFAGHGERDLDDPKSGWLVPADGRARTSSRDESTWLSYDELNGLIRRMRAKHVLLLLDCCYGGVMTRFRSGETHRFGTLLLTERARLVIASGRPNERVPDGSGAHSPFLISILDALRGEDSALTASALYARIQQSAPEYGGALPVFAPLEGGGTGDVVFFLRGAGG